jgi:transposase-like protein
MRGHGEKFGRKKEAAVLALLTQRNVEEAARSIGIDANTLLRWMKLPEFQAAYRQARWFAYGQAIARLHQAAKAAAATLLRTMLDPATPPATRVRAADSILNHGAKSIETEDIQARLEELERAAELNKTDKRK